jgi:hypothetical protein
MERCHTLMPTFDQYFFPFDLETSGCLKACAHNDEHLTRLDGGRIVAWEYDLSCTACDPEECECFVWRIVTLNEAIAMLKEKYGEAIPTEVLRTLSQGSAK